MHVPAAVISLSVAPKDRAAETNFSKALNRFTKEDPTFRVHQDEESQQTIISGMGELHLDIYMERMKREYSCEVISGKPQVAYRETITQRSEIAYTHKKQTGGSGQFARVMGYMEPLPADAVENYEFVDETTGGSIPKEFIQACDKGFKDGVKRGNLIGFPVVAVRCVVNDGQSHAVDSSDQGVPHGLLDGLSRSLLGRQAHDSRADHEGGNLGPDRVPGLGRRSGQPAPRRDLGDGQRRERDRDLRSSVERHVRLLDGPPLRHAGQGQLHDGVRALRPRAEARAGRDDQGLPREAGQGSGRA